MGEAENIELVRRGFDAYERRDLDAVFALLDPEVEIFTDAALVNAGTYRGYEGFLTWVARWNEAWEEFRMRILEIEAVGPDHVVAVVEQYGVGAGSGIEVTGSVAYMWEVHDGLGTRIHLYTEREQAVEAARSRASR
jgi:uncharacterized protein